jgi:mRNA-degrading endonuclease RelE of RelBE toxin-antitoxin system
MPYEVILTRPGLRAYQKLPYKLKVAVDRCIIELEENPKYDPNILKLKGQSDCFRYQVGGWRILLKLMK